MNQSPFFPSVSVIINTDGRVDSLATCLASLRYLRYPNFEVVVVAGPTRDGTHELCESYGDSIKFALCPERNLSQSRNISIAISAGEFVAFLDDDSVPEPEWLDDIMPAFKDPEVAVAGGFLHDHTGKTYQWTFGTVDRFGNADTSWKTAAPHFNFPGSFNYPHVMANSAFRRSAIVEVGGFDEEYEYFLDESDLIVRFVDAGFKVAQLDVGFVHHKYMPSHIRNESKVLTSWFSVIKNKTYFALQHARGHVRVDQIAKMVLETIEEFRSSVKWAISEKKLGPEYLERFEEEVDRAMHQGLQRGLDGNQRIPGGLAMEGVARLTPFEALCSASEQRCYVFLSKTYPPASVGGIGRYIHQLAVAVAAMGHQVHVLTSGAGHDRVDFEDGVWVHRISSRHFEVPRGMEIPQHLWDYSRTMLAEADEVASRREIDVVYAPVWDLEGIAFLDSRSYRLVTSLQTTMASYLDANVEKRSDVKFMTEFARPVLALEAKLMQESDRIHAISNAIVGEIEGQYGFTFDRGKLDMIPLGLDDWSELPIEKPASLAPGVLRLCFIGRLELRKGADVFLGVIGRVLQHNKNVHIDLIGNDTIVQAYGDTMRARFEKEHPELVKSGRVLFHGSVSEEALRGFYRDADLIVAPSRFESFGLVHLEGLMFGKPVIGCNIGGMPEVIADQETGLLAIPGNAESLFSAIVRLLDDADTRELMAKAARRRYLQFFQTSLLAEGIATMFRQLKIGIK